ncbi:MAG: Tim44 domain-containing protein [Burkholderiales bacterium]
MPSFRPVLRTSLAGLAALFTVLTGTALLIEDAEARRLGGARSFGRQTQNLNRAPIAPAQKAPAQEAAAKPGQTQPAAPAATGNRWLGPLTGLAAGLGIAALLSHLGLAGPMAEMLGNILMIALLAFAAMFLWRMLRGARSATSASPMKQAFETPQSSAPFAGRSANTNAYGQPIPPLAQDAAPTPAEANWSIPADFDVEGFLRNAKVYFNRLQAAWDARDLADIRRFTTPEAFAEISVQQEENAGPTDHTEVRELNAELLGIETTDEDYVASVRFTGTLRENEGEPAEFTEIWNLVKPVRGKGGWLLAGIQQAH